MNSHTYIPQSAQLKQMVRSIWQVAGFMSFRNEQIIPKGVTEIIFNFSDTPFINAVMANKQYRLGRCFINGFNSAPIQMELPTHRFFFGVELQAVAIKKLIKTPAGEFADLPVDLTLIDPSFEQLWQRLAEADDFDQRVSIINTWAGSRFINWDTREASLNDFLYAPNMINISVPDLAKHLYWSPRHMSRKIKELTGMNSEEILLYKKYLHAVSQMHHTQRSLTQVAYDSHFTDQSHFIRTFRAFTRMTPGDYSRNKSRLPGHIFENVR